MRNQRGPVDGLGIVAYCIVALLCLLVLAFGGYLLWAGVEGLRHGVLVSRQMRGTETGYVRPAAQPLAYWLQEAAFLLGGAFLALLGVFGLVRASAPGRSGGPVVPDDDPLLPP